MSNICKKNLFIFIFKNLGIFVISASDGEIQKIFLRVLFKKSKMYSIEGTFM